MSEEEINQEIKKLLGLDNVYGLKKHGLWWRPNDHGYTGKESEAGRYTMEQAKARSHVHGADDDVTIHEFTPRNYTQSLDACATFESGEGFDYWDMLYDVCNRAGALGCIGGIKRTDECWMRTNKATPLQRCEAFLRLHGKWVAS